MTATRRSESIQAVPLSITAVTEQALEKRAATSFFDYGSSIPNLAFGYSGGGASAGQANSRSIAIRGIAGTGTTGVYIDDTPVPTSIDPKIIDVSRIEVLRGPQGTLFGALSMGGTLRMITEQPANAFAARAHVSVSGTDHAGAPNYQADGAVNLPLVDDKLALRITGVHEQLGGYFQRYVQSTGQTIKNVGQSLTDGVQVALQWHPAENWTVTPRILYQDNTVNGLSFSNVPYDRKSLQPIVIRPTNFVQVQPFNVPESSADRWTLASLDIKYSPTFGTFVLSSSYFERHTSDVQDQSVAVSQLFGTPVIGTSIEDRSHPRILTEELRYSSSFGGPLQFVSGLYYQRTDTSGVSFPPNVIPGLNAASGGTLGTDLSYYATGKNVQTQYAAYTEGTWDVTDHIRATAGIRASRIESTSGPNFEDGLAVGSPTTTPLAKVSQDIYTPKFSLQYRFTPNSQIYATAAKGFRPGSASGGNPPAAICAADAAAIGVSLGSIGVVQPDTVWSYEVGGKASWLNHRLTTNVSLFQIDWDKIQQSVHLACGFGFSGNAGAARSRGGEFEADMRVTDNLSLQFSGGYDDAKFTQTVKGVLFQAGDRIPQIPLVSVQAGADYEKSIRNNVQAFGHVDYRYVSDSWSTNNARTNPATGRVVPLIRPAYQVVDLRGGFRFNTSEVAVFVKNLTNEIGNLSDTTAIAVQVQGITRAAISPPRTIGIEYRFRY